FRTAYYRGRVQIHPALVLYARRTKYPYARVGITAGKKVGGAVQRNRARRLLREAYRAVSPGVGAHWDVVLVARARILQMKSTQLQPVLRQMLTAAGVVSA
ncbi:MAG: ribonuclease P protein component, partial [Clostridia bacterium]|nr:ribonuclease P protein component [Clostridia bacterium]